MTNQFQNSNVKIYDLEERTARFGEEIIEFTKKLDKNPVNNIFISQGVRSATSIGANYMEADCAMSKKDFVYKINLCKKEAKETCHWLRMTAKANLNHRADCRRLWKEAHELTLIFSKIILSSKKNKGGNAK